MPGMTIRELLTRFPDNQFLADHELAFSYAQIYQRCTRISRAIDDQNIKRVACFMSDSIDLISVMLGAALGGKSLLVINREFSSSQLSQALTRFEIDLLVTENGEAVEDTQCTTMEAPFLWEREDQPELARPEAGKLLILTSGTTGEPKCAEYEWHDLLAQVQQKESGSNEIWLLAYRLNHFAGIQMLMHAMTHGSQLVIPESSRVVHAIDSMRHHKVTHVSATPTFWRYALANLQDNDESLPLEHITLGSEAVSGDILEKLQERFPEARVVHIYASTEAGSCVSVSDGLAGLPASILERGSSHSTQLEIRNGELHIKSRHGMRGYVGNEAPSSVETDGWLATGDLVKVENDRIVFLGRRSETINVGGTKVHPLEIENAISALHQVKLVRVYGQENPVVGEIVAVEIVPHKNVSENEIQSAVREACKDFSRVMQPRSINVVSNIATNNLKVARGK